MTDEDTVTVPADAWRAMNEKLDRILNLLESDTAEDIAALRAFRDNPEETFPAHVINRIFAGESPIKVYREYRKMTQAELAKKAETSSAYISQMENGTDPGRKTLDKLAEALDVDPDMLLPVETDNEWRDGYDVQSGVNWVRPSVGDLAGPREAFGGPENTPPDEPFNRLLQD